MCETYPKRSKLRTWNPNTLLRIVCSPEVWTHSTKDFIKNLTRSKIIVFPMLVYWPCPARIVFLYPYPLRFPIHFAGTSVPEDGSAPRPESVPETWKKWLGCSKASSNGSPRFPPMGIWLLVVDGRNPAPVDSGWAVHPIISRVLYSQVVSRISSINTMLWVALQVFLKKNQDQTECRLSFTWNFSNVRCLDSILEIQLDTDTAMSLGCFRMIQKTEKALHGSEWFAYNCFHMCTVPYMCM